MTTLAPPQPARPDTAEPSPGHDPHLAHHFDSTVQQFEAAKLGMWLFLATEVLLFGGLFCVYAVFRATRPEIFAYGSQFLDTRWGLINTAVLIASSLTMASAVTASQRGQYRLLVSLLVVTFLGGAMFMSIKYVEYHHKFHERLVWGAAFYDAPEWAIEAERHHAEVAAHGAAATDVAAPAAAYTPDPDHGRELWNATCRSCHGVAGEGVAGQGKDVRGVEFVTSRTDRELLDFIVIGRPVNDPLNSTGVAMPPRGGNPLLSNEDLLDVIAVVRTFEGGAQTTGSAEPAAAAETPEPFWLPSSSIPLAPPGPAGLRSAFLTAEGPAPVVTPAHDPHHAVDPARPANAHLFFGIYFCMTGLHGIHVLVGMVIIAWLAVRAMRREFGPDYFTPVDLGGLYWHVVDLIWIFLFPLLYLIA
ncbi:MAG: hypothetical protein HKO59_00750 [Phycisphaerales bacterium]|nr:cytochrome c oxidase subunit 3 [Phycisphaerae bacterium]NNF42745.1 hypothetical protein [Phycisphaerales bacterium]NNM24509.1 hypothetical protein [Phycisphaerales bacterium]